MCIYYNHSYCIYIYIFCCPHKFTSSSSPRPSMAIRSGLQVSPRHPPSPPRCVGCSSARLSCVAASPLLAPGRRAGRPASRATSGAGDEVGENGVHKIRIVWTLNCPELNRINIQICIQSIKFGIFISGFVGRFVGGSWPTSSWGRWSREPTIRKRRGAWNGGRSGLNQGLERARPLGTSQE